MADIKSPEERSKNMSRIKGKDTKPEIYIRKKLYESGFRYRKNSSKVPGHPDIWMSKYNTAIFVHGCYWHRHRGCKYAYMPKSREDFWAKKFEANVKRDEEVRQQLTELGIRNLIIWECTINKMLKSGDAEQRVLDEITHFLESDEPLREL